MNAIERAKVLAEQNAQRMRNAEEMVRNLDGATLEIAELIATFDGAICELAEMISGLDSAVCELAEMVAGIVEGGE